jgi:peptidyl-prolyl cis-trans isomerase SurA
MLRSKLMQRLQETQQLTPLAPTEEEMRAYYEANRANFGRRPATVSFRQIVVRVDADSAAMAVAEQLADSLARAIRDGADFGQVARRYSGDPTTRDVGGELGWVRRGFFVPEFEAVAFSGRLRPGEISDPVRTVFGYHVIEVQRSQPAEVRVRHILIQPEITEEDRQRAMQRSEDVAAALKEGAPMDSLADLYHDYAGLEQTVIEDFPQDSLPPLYRDALAGATPGDILGPYPLDLGDGRPKYTVIRLDIARPEGEFTYEEIRDRSRARLAEENALNRYLSTLREATYIDVRY